ncbi:MAG: TonB-dependent receptor [Opitutales bacterium]|nr:TonB-dependent receptor [Opitutales bacterium]
MKTRFSHAARALALCLYAIPCTLAAENGAIKGQVNVASENILSGVQVEIPELNRTTSTDRYGNYSFLNIPEGQYQLRFNYLGLDQIQRSANVADGETAVLDVSFLEDVIELEPLEVVATASSEARALNQQRTAVTLTNIVAADAFGKFPDQNAAEALSRVPGIAVDRDQGEGRYVVIRGVDSNLTSFSVDGVTLASPKSSERAVLMDIIPSGVMNALEVFKVTSPDQTAEGIGGYVNVRTPSAFEEKQLVMRASVQGNYSELSGNWGERIEATYGNLFGSEGRIGFMATVSYDYRDFGSDNQEAAAWEDEDGVWVTDELEYREYNLTRKRYGANFNLEYKRDADLLLYVRGNFNRYVDHEYRNLVDFDFGDANLVGTSNGIITWQAAEDEEIKVANELKDRTEKLSLAGLSVGAEHVISSLSLDYQISYSHAEEDTPYDVETGYELESDDATYFYTSNSTYHPSVGYASGTNYLDASNYEFDKTESATQLTEEDDISAQFNARYDFKSEQPLYIKVGSSMRLKDKSNDSSVWTYKGIPDYEEMTDLATSMDYPYGAFPFINHSYSGYFNRNKNSYEEVTFEEVDSLAEDFESEEDVYSAYIMGGIERGSHELRGGLRMEHTRFSTSGWNIVDEVATRMKADKDYTDFMPGVLYRYSASDNLILRASWTNTIARPIFAQNAAASITDGDEIERGNPDLDPYKSMNFDLSAEYYMPHLGMLSASLFHKEIKDFIYEQNFEETIGGEDYEITTFNNGDNAEITGVELACQQLFTMLPDPWDGFGFLANLTVSNSNADFSFDREDSRSVEMPRQSDIVGNIALTYSKYGFFFRVAKSYRSEYLDELGEEAQEDRFIDAYSSVDISTSYELRPGWTLYANIINIGDEPLRAYYRDSNKLSQYEKYGRTYQVGVKWNY